MVSLTLVEHEFFVAVVFVRVHVILASGVLLHAAISSLKSVTIPHFWLYLTKLRMRIDMQSTRHLRLPKITALYHGSKSRITNLILIWLEARIPNLVTHRQPLFVLHRGADNLCFNLLTYNIIAEIDVFNIDNSNCSGFVNVTIFDHFVH